MTITEKFKYYRKRIRETASNSRIKITPLHGSILETRTHNAGVSKQLTADIDSLEYINELHKSKDLESLLRFKKNSLTTQLDLFIDDCINDIKK